MRACSPGLAHIFCDRLLSQTFAACLQSAKLAHTRRRKGALSGWLEIWLDAPFVANVVFDSFVSSSLRPHAVREILVRIQVWRIRSRSLPHPSGAGRTDQCEASVGQLFLCSKQTSAGFGSRRGSRIRLHLGHFTGCVQAFRSPTTYPKYPAALVVISPTIIAIQIPVITNLQFLCDRHEFTVSRVTEGIRAHPCYGNLLWPCHGQIGKCQTCRAKPDNVEAQKPVLHSNGVEGCKSEVTDAGTSGCSRR